MNHRWKVVNRFPFKTERECTRGCPIIKVSWHPDGRDSRDPSSHYDEFWKDGEKIERKGTPACEPVQVEA